MRLATWNVNSLKARLERVEEWVAQVQPDVLCMQETKLADEAFPAMAFQALGYETAHHGEGRWNGVAIPSRVGLDDVVAGFATPTSRDAEARLIWATCGGVRVGQRLRAQRTRARRRPLPVQAALARAARAVLDDQYAPSSIARHLRRLQHRPRGPGRLRPGRVRRGDPHQRAGARRRWARARGVGARRRVPPAATTTAGSSRGGTTGPATSTRARACASTSSLATAPLAAGSTGELIDRNARKGKGPSDHAPVIVDFDLGTSSSDGRGWRRAGPGSCRVRWTRASSAPEVAKRVARDAARGDGRRGEPRCATGRLDAVDHRPPRRHRRTHRADHRDGRRAAESSPTARRAGRGGTLYEGFAEVANAGGDPHAMFEHSPFIGRANPLSPPILLQEVDGQVARPGRLRLGLRGPARLCARRLRRRGLRRGARCHPVAVGCAGHDRHAHGELPQPDAAAQPT